MHEVICSYPKGLFITIFITKFIQQPLQAFCNKINMLKMANIIMLESYDIHNRETYMGEGKK